MCFKIICFKVFIFINFQTAILGFLEKSHTTTISVIEDYGYPWENHTVTTVDGYILTIFRIPYSPNHEKDAQLQSHRPVVYLMHGLGSSSSDWVLNGSPRSLGFLLSDNGYDVWLGNARGTRYSQQHVALDPNSYAFWNFSWHEIGVYDLPTSVDYIRAQTSNEKLYYIGHSQGATSYFVATSLVPSFNDKLISAHLMSPLTFVSHSPSVGVQLLSSVLGEPSPLSELIDGINILPSTHLTEVIGGTLCKDTSPLIELCADLTFLIFGSASPYTNRSSLEMFFKTIPAGASGKQLIHYLQLYQTDSKFRRFDNGRILNEENYHQITPPDYPLEKITASTYLYYCNNDAFADPEDVDILISRLSSNTLKRAYEMPYEKWNHFDFIIGNNVNERLYNIVINDMSSPVDDL